MKNLVFSMCKFNGFIANRVGRLFFFGFFSGKGATLPFLLLLLLLSVAVLYDDPDLMDGNGLLEIAFRFPVDIAAINMILLIV